MKVTDPVCKMTIEDAEAAATSIYKGTTYYFCSKPCKQDFDKDPESFIGEKASPRVSESAAEHTCPMHPEVRKKGPGSCPTCGMALEPVEPPPASSKTEWTCPM
ncbi:MAG TPA: YHS domain-containing protein, partial [Nitrospirota bacterium]|nr:YHS domain-containing protein [Nitrospirota bacterium]